MARKDDQIRERLTAAASTLRSSGSTDLAEAVDLVLAPGGWGILRRSDPLQGEAASNLPPNLAIRMGKSERARIKAAHEKAVQALPASKRAKYSLSAVVDEGFEKFLDGGFVPEQAGRSEYGAGEEKVNLNVRPDADLRRQVEQAAVDRADELGWTPKAMHVAAAYLMHKYPAPKTSRARK